MVGNRHLSIPVRILAGARYAAAVVVPGSDRPSGAGLTGSDLQLWYVLLDAVEKVDRSCLLSIPQASLTSAFGRLHPDRLAAALDRLKGTDLMIEHLVMPLLVDHARHGVGREPRIIALRFDRRLVELVRASIRATERLDVTMASIRPLSSRHSVALHGRFTAWKSKAYPTAAIPFRAHPKGRAFEADIPVSDLGAVFAFEGVMRPSVVERLLVTSAKTCPLKRELERGGIAVETSPLISEIAASRLHGVRLRIGDIVTPVADLKAAQRHKRVVADHWKSGA